MCRTMRPSGSAKSRTLSVPPYPVQSGAITWWAPARAARLRSQLASAQSPGAPPCSRISGGLSPA